MDKFRAKTALWSTAAGYVDATTNFRPVQSNPSCISKCAGDDELEYCPLGTELEEEDEDTAQLLPLWISLGVLVAILLILLLVRCTRSPKQAPMHMDKHKQKMNEMTKVPTASVTFNAHDLNTVNAAADGNTANVITGNVPAGRTANVV